MSTSQIALISVPFIALLIHLALFPAPSKATDGKSATVGMIQPKGEDFSKTSKCNVFWTAFLPGNCEVYKFDGKHFEDKRVKQLEDIYRNGGSVQSNDALEYGEYLAMTNGPFERTIINSYQSQVDVHNDALEHGKNSATKNGPFDPALIAAYQSQVKLLNQKIDTFVKDHGVPMRRLRGGNGWDAELRKGVKDGNLNSMQVVMECKIFMAELMHEGAPGAWLDLQTFMNVRHTDSKYVALRYIYECATLQHKKLDGMINQAIVDEHILNRPKFPAGKQKFNRVIVEGAGPVGLFAAFQFFMAGANVLIVNDRTEYTRNRAIFFDQRWMQQLRFLMGTQFNDLFVDKMSPGYINMPENVGQTNIKEMEVSLMKRLKSLEQFLNSKFGPNQTNLNLRYGVKFERVEKSSKSETGQIGILTESKGKEKKVEEEVDFLVCAGGANDRIRDKYIGPIAAQSVTKYYGVVIYIKHKFEEVIFDQRTIFYAAKLGQMVEHLRAYEIDQLIRKSGYFLPAEFHQKYKNLTDLIAAEGHAELVIRLFETKGTVHIASITPTVGEEFFKKLDEIQKRDNSAEIKEKLKHFRAEIEQKWGSALYRVSMELSHPDQIPAINAELRDSNLPDSRVKFDPYPVNITNFPVTINAVKNAVDMIEEGKGKQQKEDGHGERKGPKTITIAVGDGNTSPHFMTSSGVSSGIVKNTDDLVKKLEAALNSIKKRVVAKVKQEVPHLKWLPEAEVDYSSNHGPTSPVVEKSPLKDQPSESGVQSRSSG